MRRIVWVLAGFVGFEILTASSALALEGQVVDVHDGQPMANVEITVVGRSGTARSDAEGRFVLVPDPHPPFELLVTLPGGRLVKPIFIDEVPSDAPLVLEIEPMTTEAVTVTAGAAPGLQASPANGTTFVSRADAETRAPRNLTQVLENVPGISSVSEGHAAVPAIRGMAQARTLMLIDGARVTAERRVGPSASYLDPFVLESVEVSRGPGSVAYGSDAFGGVIMAETRRPRPGGDLAGRVHGTLGAGVPEARVGAEIESGLGDRSGILFSAHYRSFSDYDSPDGEVPNSGSQDQGFLARYAYVLDHGVLSFGVQRDEGNDIERPRTNSDVVRFYYPTEDSTRWTASYESGRVGGLDSTELSLFYGEYRIVTDQDTVPTSTTPRSIARSDVDARDFGLRGVAGAHWGQTRFDFGVDVNGRFDLAADDVTIAFDLAGNSTQYVVSPTIEEARRIDTGVFVSAEGAVRPWLSLAGGARFDWVEATNEGGYFGNLETQSSEPSGYAAATAGPFSGFSTTLQYSRGFRDARLSDRFFRGVTGAGFITGNPDLEAETSDQYDLALRYTRGSWHTALYAYEYDIDDMIERTDDPSVCQPLESNPLPDLFCFLNRARAEIRGVELEARTELSHGISLLISATLSEGESPDDGQPVDDIQPATLIAQARKEFGDRAFVQMRGALVGDLDEPGPDEVEVEGHGLVDVAAGWTLSPGLELQLLVRNLFDESYALSADARSPLAPGRSGTFSVTARF